MIDNSLSIANPVSLLLKLNNKKKYFCSFEHVKMHCDFPDFTNASQMKIWVLSDSTCYKGDHK